MLTARRRRSVLGGRSLVVAHLGVLTSLPAAAPDPEHPRRARRAARGDHPAADPAPHPAAGRPARAPSPRRSSCTAGSCATCRPRRPSPRWSSPPPKPAEAPPAQAPGPSRPRTPQPPAPPPDAVRATLRTTLGCTDRAGRLSREERAGCQERLGRGARDAPYLRPAALRGEARRARPGRRRQAGRPRRGWSAPIATAGPRLDPPTTTASLHVRRRPSTYGPVEPPPQQARRAEAWRPSAAIGLAPDVSPPRNRRGRAALCANAGEGRRADADGEAPPNDLGHRGLGHRPPRGGDRRPAAAADSGRGRRTAGRRAIIPILLMPARRRPPAAQPATARAAPPAPPPAAGSAAGRPDRADRPAARRPRRPRRAGAGPGRPASRAAARRAQGRRAHGPAPGPRRLRQPRRRRPDPGRARPLRRAVRQGRQGRATFAGLGLDAPTSSGCSTPPAPRRRPTTATSTARRRRGPGQLDCPATTRRGDGRPTSAATSPSLKIPL